MAIPATVATPATTPPTPAKLYTVQEGDTIITIALDHNLDWQECELNGLQPDSLLDRPADQIAAPRKPLPAG
ncbi:MAG: LysM peptidoglycan-binding domain-containing protein [Anaerolineales bacterium]|nr:LysM peptidoglycan-binding domain-containing protein [Anaerolineales bacterium]